jgi:hypothetical protein|tara:strand:+ start:3221 stop:6460 length:3240 start_codon:yes stop_codon:yes gene_type:complete
MENKKSVKKPLLISTLIIMLLLVGVFANMLLERNPLMGEFTSPNSSKQTFASFYEDVVPILDRHCSVCHGVNAEKYQNIKESAQSADLLRWQVGISGRIETIEQSRQLYDAFLQDSSKNNVVEYGIHPIESHLLRASLAKEYSGSMHHEIFYSPDDKDFLVLKEWVESIHGNKTKAEVQQSESEAFFAEKVVPVLVRKNCFGCHGPMAFNDLRLDPGIPMLDDRFTGKIHRKNRLAMIGTKSTRMVHLSGDVEQSKQLLKNIPVEQGGMVHIGGNNFLEKDDPDYQILLRWLELEKEAAQQETGTQLGLMNGIIYVQRPEATPERFFEDDAFHPGADIFWTKDSETINLTASLHPEGPVDIRAPDVSYDAKKILFSMRLSEKAAFNIWELELESGAVRQITFSEDPDIHFKDPLYIPNPEDDAGNDLGRVALAFVSNLAGEYCQSSPGAILGEAEKGSLNAIIDHQRREKAGTFNNHTITIVKGTNKGEVRKIVSFTPGKIMVNRPFTNPCNSSTHYEIETKARMAPKYDIYRMHLAEKGKEKNTFQETLTRMSYSVSQIRRPTMRSDGEIMLTALRTGRQEGREFFNGALFRTHVDGSNLHAHNGNRSGIPIFADDREMPNGFEIRIGRDANSYWGGMLILSDHQFGPTIENNNPTDNLDHPYQNGIPENSKVRFVPGWISLDSLAGYGGVSTGGAYRDPYPLPDGSILVSHAKGPVDLHDPNANPDFDIIKLSPDPAFQSSDGFNFGNAKREVVVSGTGSQLWPRPVAPRLKEPVYKKLKADAYLYGAPKMRNGFTQYPDSVAASLQVSDLLLLEAFFEQIVPVGEKNVTSSDVRYARVIGAQPQHKGDSGPMKRFLIAEVPVEEDGSFYLQVPSKVSFDIQALNAKKMAISSPNRWLYCQPGEKHSLSTPGNLFAQGCAGCHGSLTGLKEDVLRRPDAVSGATLTMSYWNEEEQRSLLPANYSGTKELAIQFISYEQHIEPVVQNKCVSCHTGGKVDLSKGKGYGSLIKFVEQREALAIKSYLIEKLLGKELLAAQDNPEDRPHPSGDPLSEEEMLTFIRWIDLGALQYEEGKGNE